MKEHLFACRLTWTGAARGATTSYASYSREVMVHVEGKPPLTMSAAPEFRGDPAIYNPEDLLVASLAACHFLSYAALCARRGVHLVAYEDDARGVMSVADGVLRFREVTLHPRAVIAAGDPELARALHEEAHRTCFIARSVNFPVTHQVTIEVRKPA